MKKTINKVLILLLIFIAAIAVYFMWPSENEQKADIRYTAIGEASLPVIYPKLGGREMAPVFGHMEERKDLSERFSLLVLPESRQLEVRADMAEDVTGIRYEIRTMDLKDLIERTEIRDFAREEDEIRMTLPIQNILKDDTEYRLGICLTMEEGTEVWYYTRIVKSDVTKAEQMLNLAEDFSSKTFSYEESKDLTMYMETSPLADHSTYGDVTLESSFEQLTWGHMNVERYGDIQIALTELQGDLGSVRITYDLVRQEKKELELFEVTEEYTMRYTPRRIYMMDFHREMNQMFTGSGNAYTGKRIVAGINSGNELYAVKSMNNRYTAFVINRELWCFDQAENISTRVFTFAGAAVEDVREKNREHGIEILEVSEEGQIDFLLYGYMNRGIREGQTGISLYRYIPGRNGLEELLFIPSEESFERLHEDIMTFSYKGSNGILYLLLDGSVFGIDLDGFEYMTVATGLNEDKFAVSEDRSRFAWQEDTGAYDSAMIHIMDLDTGSQTAIGNGDDHVYRILGFVGNDCVYGIGKKGDYIKSNGRITGVFMDRLEIVDEEMKVVMDYEKNGLAIRDVEVKDSRIHIHGVYDKSGGFFASDVDDTLVCNAEGTEGRTDLLGWYADDVKGKISYISLAKDITSDRKIRTTAPKKAASRENALTEIEASEKNDEEIYFLSYARSGLMGIHTSFSDAVGEIYDVMGFVTDRYGDLLYTRGGKPSKAMMRESNPVITKMEQTKDDYNGTEMLEDGSMLLDASGCTLDQMLYFTGNGMPVIAHVGEGASLYLLGYDASSVTLYYPGGSLTDKMEIEQARDYFSRLGNDFAVLIEKEQ